MKFKLLMIFVATLFITSFASAQDDEDWKSDSYIIENDPLKFFKEKYEKTYPFLFEEVYPAIKNVIADMNCMIVTESQKQDDEGLQKGIIKSDFRVLAVGSDTTMPVMKRYSYDFPVIRGGVWSNGRVQYKFLLKEQEDGDTYVLLKVELSGKEDYVTRQVQFWKSNGVLEKDMFEAIDAALGLEPTEKVE